MEAVGVAWGYGTSSVLLAAGAAAVCETSDELELELNQRLDGHA
jgi:phosphoglycolate phosphatase-like HAD superfamily hydrolase